MGELRVVNTVLFVADPERLRQQYRPFNYLHLLQDAIPGSI
jgi:hypothetical protein